MDVLCRIKMKVYSAVFYEEKVMYKSYDATFFLYGSMAVYLKLGALKMVRT
jgi:hypothetical protein